MKDKLAVKCVFNLFKNGKSLAIILILLLLHFISCNPPKKDKTDVTESEINFSSEDILKGKSLSEKYCIQCHLYTPPDLLPKAIWDKEILPKMGYFYGIYQDTSRSDLIEPGLAEKIILEKNVFPSQPLIDSTSWELIKAYYLSEAPVKLSVANTDSIEVKDIFSSIVPKERIAPPMTTMIEYKEQSGLIYHSDVKKDVSLLNIYNSDGFLIQAIGMGSPATNIDEKSDGLWVLNMGKFTSTDSPTGNLSRISKRNNSVKYNSVEVLIDSLQRPCDVAYADFDQDGDEDVVIAQFGNWAGRLEWFENLGKDQYKRHSLIPITGAVKVKAEDLNQDGRVDILAMIAQGEESIFALHNQGNGKFQVQKILQLPPTHGSVYFDYVDLDRDGIKDIIHVTGDNADYEAIPKPYHGIRIYWGRKDFKFSDPFFIPQNGAYKALPIDFDGDGDFDLASISFFPDYGSSAKEGILILENKSTIDKIIFEPYTIPVFNRGRWIAMDVGDFNKDNKPDIVLGSFTVEDPYGEQDGIKKNWLKNSPMFIILLNQM